jgi:hypothetical protein
MRAQVAAGAVPAAEVEFVVFVLCGESRVSMGELRVNRVRSLEHLAAVASLVSPSQLLSRG